MNSMKMIIQKGSGLSTSMVVMFMIAFAFFGCVQPVAMAPNPDSSNITDNGNNNGPAITAVELLSVEQSGGSSLLVDTTALTLTFDIDPATLTADHISITGAEKGALSGTGLTRSIAISNIAVANGEPLSVSVSSPDGYTISGAQKTAVVYKALLVGTHYQGGIIAYIFQAGDPGYDPAVPHGLIAAEQDQSASVDWALPECAHIAVPGGTDTALGSGASNTDKIIAQNGADLGYAAGIARAYNGGGYTDWYLPSKDELNKICLNKALVGGFTDGISYWCSSEYNSYSGWALHIQYGVYGYMGKNHGQPVRAVRSF